jgi:hypothetical protein
VQRIYCTNIYTVPLKEIIALISLISGLVHPCFESETSASDMELNETFELSIKVIMSTEVFSSASSMISIFPTLVPVRLNIVPFSPDA